MKVKGAAAPLSTSTTQFNLSTSVWVFNTNTTHGVVTVRNIADSDDVGSIYIGAGAGAVIDLELGQGLRGANTLIATHIASGD
jgi:hypothetical protein